MDIPIPTEGDFKHKLVGQTSKFMRNLRLKAYFFLHPEAKSKTRNETYGLKSNIDTPIVPELVDFEEQVIKMIKNIKFKPKKLMSKFQKKFS